MSLERSFDAAEFDRRLKESALADSPPDLRPLLLHVLEAGGKRVRPRLVHDFGVLCGGDSAVLMDLALAVEMLHTATLVHDDIIDEATTRRGVPSVHQANGPHIALLVGDLYVARCGVHAAATGHAAVMHELFSALDSMVRGELEQRGRRFDLSQTEQDYLQTVQHKTASLLQAGCVSAVIVSGGGAPLVEAARAYAHEVGLAFQVVDDVLDYAATENALGKPVASDIREGTITLPLILAMQMSPAPLAAIVESARQRDDFSAVVQAVRRSGAIERCLEIAEQHARLAASALDAFADAPARQSLKELAAGLPQRRV